jgi:hypothetical protein
MGVIMAEVITAVTMDIMAAIIMVTTITMEGMEDGEQDWG